MKYPIARLASLSLLSLTLLACGGDEEAEAPEPTFAEQLAAAADEAIEEAAAPTVHSCQLRTHCREYTELPHTITNGENSLEITEAMVHAECDTREGTWSDGPCSDEGIAATCTESHMVWHYPAGDNLESSEGLCNEVRHGTWATTE